MLSSLAWYGAAAVEGEGAVRVSVERGAEGALAGQHESWVAAGAGGALLLQSLLQPALQAHTHTQERQ